jgi:hypothetical protein
MVPFNGWFTCCAINGSTYVRRVKSVVIGQVYPHPFIINSHQAEKYRAVRGRLAHIWSVARMWRITVEKSMDRPNSMNALVRSYPWIALLTGVVILIQAFMAGRFLYGLSDLVEEHGLVGNLTFLLAIVLVVGAWLGRQALVMTNAELILSVAILILVVAQLGLGYSKSTSASALHVANGVLVMALTSILIGISFIRQPNRAQGRIQAPT